MGQVGFQNQIDAENPRAPNKTQNPDPNAMDVSAMTYYQIDRFEEQGDDEAYAVWGKRVRREKGLEKDTARRGRDRPIESAISAIPRIIFRANAQKGTEGVPKPDRKVDAGDVVR